MRSNAIAFVVVLASAACGSSASNAGDVFPEGVYAHVESTSAAYSIDVRTSPQPPRVGVGSVELRIRDRDGLPANGLTLHVTAVMPAHGHGASVKPTVEARGGGVYVAHEVSTFMAGTWELRVVIEGGTSDRATITLDVR